MAAQRSYPPHPQVPLSNRASMGRGKNGQLSSYPPMNVRGGKAGRTHLEATGRVPELKDSIYVYGCVVCTVFVKVVQILINHNN